MKATRESNFGSVGMDGVKNAPQNDLAPGQAIGGHRPGGFGVGRYEHAASTMAGIDSGQGNIPSDAGHYGELPTNPTEPQVIAYEQGNPYATPPTEARRPLGHAAVNGVIS